MTGERCLEGDILHKAVGRELDPTADRALLADVEAATVNSDLICSALECPTPGCDRVGGLRAVGDEFDLLQGAARGVCARRLAAAKWQLAQALSFPRSPSEAARSSEFGSTA